MKRWNTEIKGVGIYSPGVTHVCTYRFKSNDNLLHVPSLFC